MTRHVPAWRLRLLAFCAAAIVCALLYRLVQVQIVRHVHYKNRADGQWHEQVAWPSRRGSILDRNGMPLAVTSRTWAVGVTPSLFPCDDGAIAGFAEAVGVSVRTVRRALRKDRPYVPLARDRRLNEEAVGLLSAMPGVRLDPSPDRIHPFGAAAPGLVGAVNDEGRGVSGIEQAFDSLLAGEDGWFLVSKDARSNVFRPVNAPGRKPVDGRDVYLTIDSRVQAIVDFELEKAVDRYGAAAGISIVLDPRTGDILALSEKRRDGGVAAGGEGLMSVSCIYEPGSTFKLVTDAYLLERGAVDPYDVFDTEGGEVEFEFGTFRDDHREDAWYSFKESFVKSSNVCTIKAVMNADPRDFHRWLLDFGFGGWTGVDLPAESRGTLRDPGDWSARSLPSIAIGQEIGVTALQMALAYGALANGGVLTSPRIAQRTVDRVGGDAREMPPLQVRRVFSDETAERMKDFCVAVVRKGTGRKAAVPGMTVAGKTGTAQKASGGRYVRGRYVASFIGFCPAEDPRLVCLVLLDEPAYPYWWGGESAAVVFRGIVGGINLATDMLCRSADGEVALGEREGGTFRAPSFLRLTERDAIRLASGSGLVISGAGEEDWIVWSQSPDPGTPMERGDEIRLLYRSPRPLAGTVAVPDCRGLSIREARRLLISCGLESRIDGSGEVRRQTPEPGRSVKRGAAVRLRCETNLSMASRGGGR
ncbi:MAG: PASTA domain-containing protein [Candidatus Krumholzibacteriota bacterium]|nr:PASTA domain-containing protein [Candidatus Krumholzibacteriota bacterium]